MNSLDLVSVVIPVYNSEKFLKKSIDSVINQTYEKIEVIAVDELDAELDISDLDALDQELAALDSLDFD